MLTNGSRIAIHVGGNNMVRREVLQKVEPEQRDLSQHPALMRDAGGQNIVEGRDAVRRDEQQMVAIEIVDVANLAAGVQFQFGVVGLQKDGVEEFGAHDVILVVKNSAYSNWREKFVNAFHQGHE